MSIVAAENAGLGPCEIPDPWVPHTTETTGVCSLPLSSPAAATAAVAVSTGITGATSLGGGNYHSPTVTLPTANNKSATASNNNNNNNANNNNKILNTNNPLILQQKATPASLAAANYHQHSPQAKIMNAVASPISANTAPSNRKNRRKTDSKPQSQINKCNNEKRRREMENNYIEQLGEFLQLNKRGDMTSSKPDKAAILNQVVKTYRDICDKGQSRDISSSSSSTATTTCSGLSPSLTTPSTSTTSTISSTGSNRCARCATDNCTIHPVQQGDISSTEPPLPEPSLNGQVPEISAYFEAIEFYISSVGWVLLQINADGCIETCTQNVRDLFGYDKSELLKQPIYSYLHSGDHAKLNPILNTMSYNSSSGNGNNNSLMLGWGEQDDTHSHQQQMQMKGKRSISTKVRMLVKESPNDAMDQKNVVRGEKFEDVVLIAAPVKDDGDDSSSLLCLITRPEDESPLEMNIQQHVVQRSLEQLTFKLDVHGKIIQTDTSALRDVFADYISKCRGVLIQDLCHIQDIHHLKNHMKEVQDSGGNANMSNFTSRPFRLRLGSPDVYMHVKANSRLFLNSTPGETDYIMSWQTLLSQSDDMNSNTTAATSMVTSVASSLCPSTIDSSSSTSQAMMPSTSHHHTTTTNVGGPLMTSVINGGSQVQASPRSGMVTAFSNSPSGPENTTTSFFIPESFDFDFQHSSFEMETVTWGDSRPNSRTSVATPVSTPRPPSGQAFSPAAHGVCQSPSTPYQISSQHSMTSQPSPQQNNNNSSSINNNNGGYHGFVFPNFDDKDSIGKDHHLSHNNNGGVNNNSVGQNNGNTVLNPSGSSSSGNSTDSERLRHLLTLKPTQPAGQSGGVHAHGMVGDETENDNHILKGLLNSEEDKEIVASGTIFKMNATGLATRLYGNPLPKTTNTNNRMLLSLLNEKSEDDDSQSKARPSSELMRQLQKDDGPKDHHHHLNHQNPNNMSSEDLKRFLKIQLEEPGKRKRPSNEPDDGKAAKRSDDKPSKLRESNRMLASLLEKSTKMPVLSSSPGVKIIPDITPSVNRVSSSSGISGLQLKGAPTNTANVVTQQQSAAAAAAVAAAAAAAAANNSHANPTTGRGRKQTSDAYLTQQQVAQQQQHHDQAKNSSLQSPSATSSIQRPQSSSGSANAVAYQINHRASPFGTPTSSTPSASAAAAAAASSSVSISSFSGSISSVTSAPSSAAMVGAAAGGGGVTISTNSQMHAMQQQQHQNSEFDPELANILNYVIDCVPDCNIPEQSFGNSTHVLSQQELNEKIAINEIQKSLMQVEASAFNSRPPPPYSQQLNSAGMTQQHQQQLQNMQANQGFQHPPPMYQPSRNVRFQLSNGNITSIPVSQLQRQRMLQAAQQKERLLQQQQKQHLLVPESATARGDQLCLNPGLNNIGSLLNNTVAPNVSLSRNNMPPDSQLSPSFAQSMIQQQLSPGQRGAPFSPHPNPGFQTQFTNNGQRLSPQQQQLSQIQQQQQQLAFQNVVGNNTAAQLSPRLPPFNVNSQSVTTGAGGVSPQQWNTSASVTNSGGNSNSRISLQQHNPMLSAQLQGVSPYRQFQTQRRTLNSPGIGGIQRQNSFPNTSDGFTGPTSPSPQSPYGGPGNVFNQQQMQRMQRQTSVPQASQHLPGSPHSFGGSDGTGGGGYGMMYNSMQHAGQGPPPNDFYGRTQTAGTGSNSSEFVRQELRAVVSGRAQQQTAAAVNNGVPGGGGVNNPSNNIANNGLRTPQSPLGLGQGPMVGTNSTNSLGMPQSPQQQQQGGVSVQQQQQLSGNSIMNASSDPTMNFGFDIQQTPDFFGSSTTR